MDVVISDLDGTLLDHDTYSFEAALPALKLLKARRTPVVYCSSKTRGEMEHWRRVTGNEHPFIVENGGAVVIPRSYFDFALPSATEAGEYSVIPLGDPYPELVRSLEEASQTSHCRVRGFHDMAVDEVARACDLPADWAGLAKAREFDEPFTIVDTDRSTELLTAIERHGKRWTRGGRFYHITGRNDKAAAAAIVLDAYRTGGSSIRSIGLGDGINDAAFLNLVDVPVLIRTSWLAELQTAVPRGRPTSLPGPQGWNEAILELFD